jgi:pimeloyl-ACP methyl ester carboxylesterase
MELQVDVIRERLASDGEFALAARFWTGEVLLEIDDDAYTLRIRDGKVEDFATGRSEAPAVRLAGTAEEWEKQLQPVPAAYWQDPLMGASFTEQAFTVEGDKLRDVFPYYSAIQRLMGVLREINNGGSTGVPTTVPRVERKFDSPVGRYVYVDVDDVQYRVYYEEAGQGIPLICQHTAGSDGRQYRHLLEDPDFQRQYRMIAYDLPYHGKSNPPSGKEWWKEEYKLTQDFLLKFVVAFCHALELDRPVFVGCSVGGFLAPDLAYYHPDEFRAVIGLNSGVYLGPDASDPEMGKSFLHPRVNSEWKAAAMMGIMAPGAPEAYRRETAWYYAQGAPPVFQGDLHYYSIEHDLRGKLDQIDTSKCAVYIVVGEYDPSRVGPLGSPAVAEGIAGSHYVVVHQGGHFLMSENPEAFKPIMAGMLDEIAAASAGSNGRSPVVAAASSE